jgi:site-specific DNA recombinase
MDATFDKTGIIYCRVSSAEQVQGTSLAMQERLCKEYAEREQIKVLNIYIEEGESAKTANRTEFQKALAFCSIKKPRVDFFIVHKVDRFARNQGDHHATRALLKKYGTELRSVTEPISDDPVGKAMEGMLSVFAEFDNNVRSARSRSGMVEKVKKGEWVWASPLGYKRLSKGGNLIVDDDVAPYIRQVFEEYAKGTHSFRSLALVMQGRGMRTRQGKNPGMQLMEKIVRNPVFYGLIRGLGMEVEGKFAPIISEALFWKCQPKKGSNKSSKFRTGRRLATNANFPLRRFAICTDCGKSFTGSISTGRKGVKYPYYHHHMLGCPIAKSFAKETMEQNFVEFLQSISPSKKFEKLFKAIVVDAWQTNYKLLDSDNARIRKELTVLEAERQRIFDMHRAGKYDDNEFLEQKNLVLEKIRQKKSLLDKKRLEEFDMEEALDYCFRFVRESAKTWLELKELPSHRLRFQNQVFPEKVTYNGKKFGTTKTAMIYRLNQENDAEKNTLVTLWGIEPQFTP